MINTGYVNSPVRTIRGKVELYDGSTLLHTYSYNDDLISFEVSRVGDEAKFFGFGICQKVNIKLLDTKRQKDITTSNSFKLYLDDKNLFPTFKVSEVHRDENTNELSITAYDCIYRASNHYANEVILSGYTIKEYAIAAANILGATLDIVGFEDESCFDTYYPEGANIDGTETLREMFDDVAEATQSIYYLDNTNTIIFKRMDRDGEPVLTITKEDYFKLDSKTNRRLTAIASITELGNNVENSMEQTGTTQYVRDNVFWNLRDDIGGFVDAALAAIGGFTINQFNCDWRGNYGLEIGDKIGLITKDDDLVYSYVLNDVLTYNGGFNQKTQWTYNNSDAETETNPSSIGEMIKHTYALVDKINRQIKLVASETTENSENIASIILNTESITQSVKAMEEITTTALGNMSGEIAELTNKVEQVVTEEEVRIMIEEELSNGVDKITTSTGFTFDDVGLTVSKSDSEMTTTITEDGMRVYKNGEEMLTANNTGVYATNLHANTYLIVGKYSRFEDYESNKGSRTGCFWLGSGGE